MNPKPKRKPKSKSRRLWQRNFMRGVVSILVEKAQADHKAGRYIPDGPGG